MPGHAPGIGVWVAFLTRPRTRRNLGDSAAIASVFTSQFFVPMGAGLGCVALCEGTAMVNVSRYRQYAADCVRQAQSEETAEDRSILLNVALAWLRLARQSEEEPSPSLVPLAETPEFSES